MKYEWWSLSVDECGGSYESWNVCRRISSLWQRLSIWLSVRVQLSDGLWLVNIKCDVLWHQINQKAAVFTGLWEADCLLMILVTLNGAMMMMMTSVTGYSLTGEPPAVMWSALHPENIVLRLLAVLSGAPRWNFCAQREKTLHVRPVSMTTICWQTSYQALCGTALHFNRLSRNLIESSFQNQPTADQMLSQKLVIYSVAACKEGQQLSIIIIITAQSDKLTFTVSAVSTPQ